MSDSVEKYNELKEDGKIKESEVHEYTCLCNDKSNCTACTKPKSYLVTRWVQNFDMEGAQDLYRFEGKSLDYVQGFIEGLNADDNTESVHLTEVEE